MKFWLKQIMKILIKKHTYVFLKFLLKIDIGNSYSKSHFGNFGYENDKILIKNIFSTYLLKTILEILSEN